MFNDIHQSDIDKILAIKKHYAWNECGMTVKEFSREFLMKMVKCGVLYKHPTLKIVNRNLFYATPEFIEFIESK